MIRAKVKTVRDYIKKQSPAIAKRLRAIRSIIKKAAPRAEEKISYRIPAYMLNGRLFYYAVSKNHIGFYVLPKATGTFKKELDRYRSSKGTARFPHDKPLPLPLIRKIVQARVKENLAKKR